MKREPIWEHEDKNIDWEKDNWDEYDWERLLAQQDCKVEQLVRLDMLFLDSGMKARDDELMGFDEDAKKSQECDRNCPECGQRFSCMEYQERLAEESREATGTPEPEPEYLSLSERMRDIPIYQKCYELRLASTDLLKQIPERFWENEPAAKMFAENCGIPAAKIVGGNAMGYGPDSIGGNIANCKRAANAMAKCVEALERLMTLPETAEKAAELKPIAEKCLPMIVERIEDLRAQARVLWGRA